MSGTVGAMREQATFNQGDSGGPPPLASAAVRPDVGRLFDLHARTLRTAVYALTGDVGVAEDVVQETFLEAWRRRDQLVDSPALKGWLYQKAYHLVQHHWRGSRRFRSATDRAASVPVAAPAAASRCGRASPSSQSPTARSSSCRPRRTSKAPRSP